MCLLHGLSWHGGQSVQATCVGPYSFFTAPASVTEIGRGTKEALARVRVTLNFITGGDLRKVDLEEEKKTKGGED